MDTAKSLLKGLLTPRGACVAAAAIAALRLLQHFGAFAVNALAWAEHQVDGESSVHMLYFVLLSLIFWIPSPLPLAMSAWSIAIGCFFKWRAFGVLLASFSIGVSASFFIGRAASASGGAHALLERWLPAGMRFLSSLRGATRNEPVKLSFLLMWAPLPCSLLPFMVRLSDTLA